jgi:Zn-finger nucleic acid-binding protein
LDEPIVLTEIKQCPRCKCKETLSRKALEAAEVELSTFGYPCISCQTIPLSNPATAAFSVKTLFIYIDYCLKCGASYMTKASLVKVPLIDQPATKARIISGRS